MKYLLLAVLISGMLSLNVLPPKIVNPAQLMDVLSLMQSTEPVNRKKESAKPVNQKKKSAKPVNQKKKSAKPVNQQKKSAKPVNQKKESAKPVNKKQQFRKAVGAKIKKAFGKKKDAGKVKSPDCSKCFFKDQGCSETCPPLCEPPVYPKCPLCRSQEHCEMVGFMDMPAPACDEGNTKCSGKGANLDRCSFELSTFIYDVYKADPADIEQVWDKPPKKETPGASLYACQCYNRQLNCMIDNVDNGCITNETSASLAEEAAENSKIMKEWCHDRMKCEPKQCSYVDRLKGNIEAKNFLNFARPWSFLP